MGIVRNRYGVYEARKKVPKRLEEATATVPRRIEATQSLAQEVIRGDRRTFAKRKSEQSPCSWSSTAVLARAEALSD